MECLEHLELDRFQNYSYKTSRRIQHDQTVLTDKTAGQRPSVPFEDNVEARKMTNTIVSESFCNKDRASITTQCRFSFPLDPLFSSYSGFYPKPYTLNPKDNSAL